VIAALKVLGYALALTAAIRGSFFFIFAAAARPGLWILLMATLGAFNMMLAWVAGWSPAIVSAAALTALIVSVPRRLTDKSAEESEERDLKKAFYVGMGVRRGWLKHVLGLVTFGASSAVAYGLLFAEACSDEGHCVPLYKALFH